MSETVMRRHQELMAQFLENNRAIMMHWLQAGGADTQARMIAEELESAKGWKIIPEQVTGKGVLNAVKALQDAPKDGPAIAMIVTETLGYHLAASNAGDPSIATPITSTAGSQMAIVSLASKGYKTLADVIAAAKGGEKLRFGAMSPRLADLAYLLGEATGIEFNTVMVRGGKGVMNGLNAGDIDIGFGAGIQNKAVAAGDMVNLLSAMSTRLKISPDAPNGVGCDGPFRTGFGCYHAAIFGREKLGGNRPVRGLCNDRRPRTASSRSGRLKFHHHRTVP